MPRQVYVTSQSGRRKANDLPVILQCPTPVGAALRPKNTLM